jgi:integrase
VHYNTVVRGQHNKMQSLQAQYERFVSATASPETSWRYSKSLDAFFGYFPEKKDPKDFSKMDVEDFKAYRRKAGVSATTVNYDLQIVRAFWNWLIQMEAAVYNPATVRRLKQTDPVRQSLSESSQSAMYDACLNDTERLLVALSLSTGLRGKTLAQLETCDFYPERNLLIVPPSKIKTGRSLELPVREDVMALVAKLPEGNIWGTKPVDSGVLSRKFTKILQRIGVPLKGIRTARRTIATTLLRNQVDVRLVANVLGHKNISTTSKYLTPATNQEISAAIGRLPVGAKTV